MVKIHGEVYGIWVGQLHIFNRLNWLLSNGLLLIRIKGFSADLVYFLLIAGRCKNWTLKYVEILMVMCVYSLNVGSMAAYTGSLLIITIKWEALIVFPIEIINVDRNSSPRYIDIILTILTHIEFF